MSEMSGELIEMGHPIKETFRHDRWIYLSRLSGGCGSDGTGDHIDTSHGRLSITGGAGLETRVSFNGEARPELSTCDLISSPHGSGRSSVGYLIMKAWLRRTLRGIVSGCNKRHVSMMIILFVGSQILWLIRRTRVRCASRAPFDDGLTGARWFMDPPQGG
ncbi:hypothetical protein EVAR_49874_1 [Eumeta japonica]|uniref:Uncharacterized protein n=1 Tax=Eumeta variegata TaxID=151549 RepID=A0A4C1XZ09_EUMVA|nr:hypothetical protein EVAR_49874_1 [Eumeta japonica]